MRTTLRYVVLTMLALVVIATASVGTAAVTTATTQARNTFENIRVRGDTDAGGVFRGRVDIKNFRSEGNDLFAVGRLSGRILDSDGDLVRRISDRRVVFPLTLEQGTATAAGVGVAQAACEILDLHLGAINLDLLGLVIDLQDIDLVITAVPGPGNLLGNLLCAIVGLLDENGVNDVLVNLLQVLRQLLDIFG